MGGGENNNISGIKWFANAWLISGAMVKLIPDVPKVYAEINNESIGVLRAGVSGTLGLNHGLLLPSGTYIADWFSSDEWWVWSQSPGSGSVSAFWVEGL